MAGWHGDWLWAQQQAPWDYWSQLDALTTAVRDLETQVAAMQTRLSEFELQHSSTSGSSGSQPANGSEPQAGQRATVAQSPVHDGSMLCAWHADEDRVEEALRFKQNVPEWFQKSESKNLDSFVHAMSSFEVPYGDLEALRSKDVRASWYTARSRTGNPTYNSHIAIICNKCRRGVYMDNCIMPISNEGNRKRLGKAFTRFFSLRSTQED